jgi:hypothetical protein
VTNGKAPNLVETLVLVGRESLVAARDFSASVEVTLKPVREGFEPSVAFWATAL